MLVSFNGKEEIKEKYLASIYDWLSLENNPKSIDKKAEEIFNPIRSYKKSDCVLENYDEFPSKLGLPIWLGNLLLTINHFNSKEFSNYYEKYEREKKYIIDIIELHKKVLNGEKIKQNIWVQLQKEIDVLTHNIDDLTGVPKELELKEVEMLKNLEYSRNNNKQEYRKLLDEYYSFERYKKSFGQIIWNTGRVAYLSIDNFLSQENSSHISSEALVDALVEEYINSNKECNKNFEEEFRKKVWFELMERLQTMLIKWK